MSLSMAQVDARVQRAIAAVQQRRALSASVLATVRAEPGEWTISALARDYDVRVGYMRSVVRDLSREVEVRGATFGARLWPRGVA